METFSIRRLIPALIFVAVAAAYLYTMNPSVSVGDSGEFIAASETLALPHAPSYPLFTLMGKTVINLFPMGSIAYRVNLVSLLAGAGTAALFFMLARSVGVAASAAFLATLIFSASQVMWEHSLSAEVFSLNGLFAAILLLVWTVPKENLTPGARAAASGLVLGLGLGNHHTLVLVVPGAALLYAFNFRNEKVKQDAALAAGFFFIGFLIYVFLPLRSFKNPPLDWSNPENLANFIRVITRADYGSLSLTLGEKLPRNFETAFQQTVRYCASITDSITIAGFLAGILGWIAWWLKDWRTCLAFLAAFLVSGIGFLLLGNIPFDAQSSGILPRFFILPWISFALALAHFFEWMRQRTRFWGALAALALLLAVHSSWKVVRHFRNDFVSYDYGRNILKTLPEKSALFMDGGDDTFYSLAYLTMAEKRRTDLEIHDRGGLIFKSAYGDDFRRLVRTEKDKRRQVVESSFLGVRRLFYSTFDRNILQSARLEAAGVLFEAVSKNSPQVSQGNYWKFYSLRGIFEDSPRPYRLRALAPLYPFLEGISTWNLRTLGRAALFGMDIGWLKANLIWEISVRGYQLSNEGRKDQAGSFFRKVLELDSKNSNALTNLGVLAADINDVKAAESYYMNALAADPRNADAHFNLGVLRWKQERWKEVIECFGTALRLKPDHPDAQQYLDAAKRKLKK
ncbi:MAG: hypothetical protein A2901_01300 [Elusimicrobia bacterium RIFCSPLOWO2_01_FULL_54_10]|nr:MAG: hypothetical protein A2901_01300 [Elusimicrobia bacterium RIFCSPLOWO2_01_FULL_54_10]